jgi:hypothetical protein
MPNHPDKLPYSKIIGKRVNEMAAAEMRVVDILAAIQKYGNAPASLATFYRLYRGDMAEARAVNAEAIGGLVVKQAISGDPDAPNTWKARELYLRAHGGWSPKTTEQLQEVGSEEEETESAVAALMKALGKDTE